MTNYSPLTKILLDNSVNKKNNPKSNSPFHSSSWIHQPKDVMKETPQEDAKKSKNLLLKSINNYEINAVYKINMNNYYKNVPIYHENRNRFWKIKVKK